MTKPLRDPELDRLVQEINRAPDLGPAVEDALLSPLVPPNGGAGDEAGFEMTPEENANDFVQWLKAHSVKASLQMTAERVFTNQVR